MVSVSPVSGSIHTKLPFSIPMARSAGTGSVVVGAVVVVVSDVIVVGDVVVVGGLVFGGAARRLIGPFALEGMHVS